MAPPRHALWADEVEQEEAEARVAAGQYEAKDDWHPGLDVQRGNAPQRLNLSHGFVRNIVRARPPSLHPLQGLAGALHVLLIIFSAAA